MNGSLVARAVKPLVRARMERRPRDGDDEAALLAARAALDEICGRMVPPPGVRFIDEPTAGVPCERIIPTTADSSRCILYLHGGAYMLGSRVSHRGLAAHLAHAVGVEALLAEYRLAPEHAFPAAIDDALAVYESLLERHDPGSLLVAGDSAGGGLAIALGVRLRDEGLPLPAGIAGISPWTDLAGTGPSLDGNRATELMLDPDRIPEIADYYHPDHPAEHPWVSPLYADLAGLPPLLLQVGDEEILLDDSTRLASNAEALGLDVSLRVWPAMFHVWHMLAPVMPESRRAINEFARWGMRVLGEA
ncbi:MAG: alpha/beta hydrolase [Acidimicrobiia bacterium]|nr:MAG: alpha/beta hydrolase [Acidimicrobiia bacterium]